MASKDKKKSNKDDPQPLQSSVSMNVSAALSPNSNSQQSSQPLRLSSPHLNQTESSKSDSGAEKPEQPKKRNSGRRNQSSYEPSSRGKEENSNHHPGKQFCSQIA